MLYVEIVPSDAKVYAYNLLPLEARPEGLSSAAKVLPFRHCRSHDLVIVGDAVPEPGTVFVTLGALSGVFVKLRKRDA